MLILQEARLRAHKVYECRSVQPLFPSHLGSFWCDLSRWDPLLSSRGKPTYCSQILQEERLPACGLRIDQCIRQIGINGVVLQSQDPHKHKQGSRDTKSSFSEPITLSSPLALDGVHVALLLNTHTPSPTPTHSQQTNVKQHHLNPPPPPPPRPAA